MTATVIMRGFEIGSDMAPEDANASQDQAGIPRFVSETYLPAVGFPWADAQEDPTAVYDPAIGITKDPQIDVPDLGNSQIVGAYDGSYQSRGPVHPFGYEVSGGLDGDQAIGRTMRFQNMGPERYDPDGVTAPSWADELAARMAHNGMGQITEAEYTTSLLQSI